MIKKKESGKSIMVKGSLTFLWEELKTLNKRKLRAFSKILTGYMKMKFAGNGHKVNQHNSGFSLKDR